MAKKKEPPANQLPLLSKEALLGPTGLVQLQRLGAEAAKCTACALHESRSRVVYGDGSAQARIALVGEGPGAAEDREGLPFVGASGRLLNQLLARLNLDRPSLYVTNAVLCRPPSNRTPTATETSTCRRFLVGQLLAVRPLAIVCLGRTAAQSLLQNEEAMRWLRGRWHVWEEIKVRVTWHPAYILRQEGLDATRARWEMWDDFTAVLEELGIPIPPTILRPPEIDE